MLNVVDMSNLTVSMFFFRIDASQEDGTLGRLVNDDHLSPNAKMKKIIFDSLPRLCLFALQQINPGDEITYDYGNDNYPWRQNEVFLNFVIPFLSELKF